MKITSIILTILIILSVVGCQLDPTSGINGSDGVDGEQGIPGEDGQDLTYERYQIFDNSGDYVGIAYVASYDYPTNVILTRSTSGYWVYTGSSYLDQYIPSIGDSVVKTSDGKIYSMSVELNWEGATACGPFNHWYKYVSNQKYDGASLDIVATAGIHDSDWVDVPDTSQYDALTYSEVTSTTLEEIGLPVYDPPFNYTLIEQKTSKVLD